MANQIYDNIVIQSKFEDMLTTALDMNQFVTSDTSLVENAGMKVKVNKYDVTGDVEDLAMGVGNSASIESTITTVEYEAKTTQGRFAYYDEQAMTDPLVIETGLRGIAAKMANDFTEKAIAEMGKATLDQTVATAAIGFDDIVDATAKLNLEDEAGLFMLINPAELAGLRKNLKDMLSYSEAFARTGYIGSVNGIPVYVSKAVPAKKAFIADKTAVTVFTKKGSEIEMERDANTRNNTIYGRKVAVVALTDATKVVKLTISG